MECHAVISASIVTFLSLRNAKLQLRAQASSALLPEESVLDCLVVLDLSCSTDQVTPGIPNPSLRELYVVVQPLDSRCSYCKLLVPILMERYRTSTGHSTSRMPKCNVIIMLHASDAITTHADVWEDNPQDWKPSFKRL